MFKHPYESIDVYIWVESNDDEYINFLKDLQKLMDKDNIGSQVMIVDKRVKLTGLRNCWRLDFYDKDWTDYILTNQDFIKVVKFKKLPTCTPEELYKLIDQKIDYNDECVYIDIRLPKKNQRM